MAGGRSGEGGGGSLLVGVGGGCEGGGGVLVGGVEVVDTPTPAVETCTEKQTKISGTLNNVTFGTSYSVHSRPWLHSLRIRCDSAARL